MNNETCHQLSHISLRDALELVFAIGEELGPPRAYESGEAYEDRLEDAIKHEATRITALNRPRGPRSHIFWHDVFSDLSVALDVHRGLFDTPREYILNPSYSDRAVLTLGCLAADFD